MMKKLWRNKRGFTLVELVVAIALTAIIASSVSVLIGTALRMERQSVLTSQLYRVSQRLHTAIDAELNGAGEVSVYKNSERYLSSVQSPELMMYLYSGSATERVTTYDDNGTASYSYIPLKGMVLKGDKYSQRQQLLLSAASYEGAVVTELQFWVDSVYEKLSTQSVDYGEMVRVLHIKTTVQKGDREYTHTSCVRLYNMMKTGAQIQKKSGSSMVTAAVDNTKYTTVCYVRAGVEE